RAGRALGHVPVARPRSPGAQRRRRLVASPRQLRAGGAMTATGHETGRRDDAAAPGAAGWLGLAAAPTFAIIALLSSLPGAGTDWLCASSLGWWPRRERGAF